MTPDQNTGLHDCFGSKIKSKKRKKDHKIRFACIGTMAFASETNAATFILMKTVILIFSGNAGIAKKILK